MLFWLIQIIEFGEPGIKLVPWGYGKRTWWMKCPDDKEREEWLKAFQTAWYYAYGFPSLLVTVILFSQLEGKSTSRSRPRHRRGLRPHHKEAPLALLAVVVVWGE